MYQVSRFCAVKLEIVTEKEVFVIHTILYLGRFSLNIDRLREHRRAIRTFKRQNEKGVFLTTVGPSDKVDGIVFGYMEKGYERLSTKDAFYAVSVEDIVLDNPLLLVPDRHTDGKWFGPSPSQFGDESARALLRDIIAANLSKVAELQNTYKRFF
jgi:hypothetical protein